MADDKAVYAYIPRAIKYYLGEEPIIQRARLINAVLHDLYGFQRSLRNGWIPAPLVYANPHFLRGCHAVRAPGGNYVPFYAVDLARSPDGQWWVLADRTQAPTGIGFALENRMLISRVIPEAVQAIQPRTVGGMLPLMREALISLAQGRRENPTMVVLTPGPRNEAYFEHTYLARMPGITLVEGGDLTVRDRHVFIKTLDGLRQVDVILRRVNDGYCDPLEFRGDSLLGVPGLLDVVRAGNVALGNGLGCGLIDGPAFMAFFPNLCRQSSGRRPENPLGGHLVVRAAARIELRERAPRSTRHPARRNRCWNAATASSLIDAGISPKCV